MLRFECDEKGASTGICSGIELLEWLRPPTLSAAFLVCCVAAGSALCACIDRVVIERITVNIALRAAKSKKKPSG
jgi:hypothetical protein